MPKIPTQKARTVMPNVGGGGGGGSRAGGGGGGGAAMGSPTASRYANIEGTGLQSAGQQIASGAAGLSQAFQHAGQVRDQINAHLESMRQKTGAQQMSLDAKIGIEQDREFVMEQLRTQQDKDQNTWMVTVPDMNGEPQRMRPDDAMQFLLTKRMNNTVEEAGSVLGPEAQLFVAESINRDGQTAYSAYSDQHIKLKHDKQLGDWETVGTRLELAAGDLTNPYAETAKTQLMTHIDNGVRDGIILPTEGAKRKETMGASITDKRLTLEAIRAPHLMLERIAGVHKEVAASVEKIGTAALPESTFQALGLPKDMDLAKLPHYQELALGEMSRRQAAADRHVKAYEAGIKAHQEKTWGDDLAIVLEGGSVMGNLPRQIHDGEIDPDKANTLRMVEHAIKERKAHDPVLIRQSALTRVGLSSEITEAMFGGKGNLDEIEHRTMHALIADGLTKEDTNPLMGEIRTAKAHLASEQGRKENEETQAAKHNLYEALKVTGPFETMDPISQQVKRAADTDFHWMKANTKMKPWDINEELVKRYEPIIQERRNILGESPELAKLTDEKLNSAVMRGRMTRAGAQAVRERKENERGQKIVTDALKAYKPPPLTTWEKAQKLGTSISEFGHRILEDPGTEAQP